MYVFRNGPPPSSTKSGRPFHVGATPVAPQFQHGEVLLAVTLRSVTISEFLDIPQFLQENIVMVPRLGHHISLSNPFQFVIHERPYHSTLHNPHTANIVKYPPNYIVTSSNSQHKMGTADLAEPD
jgi:hypothetical protein